jgi:hypothetical protein
MVQVKVKFTLEQATKAHRGDWRYGCTLSLTSALDGVGGQRHIPATLPSGKRPGTHFTAGWVGPSAGLDGYKKFLPHRDSIPVPSSP